MPGLQALRVELPLANRLHTPQDQGSGHQGPKGVELQGLVPIAPQAGAGGPGEEAGGARDAGEGP